MEEEKMKKKVKMMSCLVLTVLFVSANIISASAVETKPLDGTVVDGCNNVDACWHGFSNERNSKGFLEGGNVNTGNWTNLGGFQNSYCAAIIYFTYPDGSTQRVDLAKGNKWYFPEVNGESVPVTGTRVDIWDC